MSKDEFLVQYELALQSQLEAEKRVKILEMQAKLSFSESPSGESKSDHESNVHKFVSANRGELTRDDIEFMSVEGRTTDEVFEYLTGPSRQTIRRWVNDPNRKFRLVDGSPKNEFLINSLSVVEELLYGKDGKTR